LALSQDPSFLAEIAYIAAAAGQDQKAESLISQARRDRPQDTLLASVMSPRVEARIQVRHGKGDSAIQTLAAAQNYEDGPAYFDTHVLRGEAYLAAGRASEAATEFRKYLSRRVTAAFSWYSPVAQLGLARALAAQHDTANSRTAYQDLFAMWKDADADIPILQQARAEYARLQ
jgi:eukaryotic-like serine/threonine-protein kinase